MAMHAPNSSASRRSRRNSAGFNDINVTPFVDVMLVLLIVFMITAPLITAGITVDLPETKSSAIPGNDEPLNITVKRSGEVFIQNSPSDIKDLGPKLIAILGEKTETRIFVRGDRSINYGEIMKVIGEINGAGFNRVALLTNNQTRKRRR